MLFRLIVLLLFSKRSANVFERIFILPLNITILGLVRQACASSSSSSADNRSFLHHRARRDSQINFHPDPICEMKM